MECAEHVLSQIGINRHHRGVTTDQKWSDRTELLRGGPANNNCTSKKFYVRASDLAKSGDFQVHDSLHGFRSERGTGTAIIEAKLSQRLAYLEAEAFFGIFIDLQKAFDAMDREGCVRL